MDLLYSYTIVMLMDYCIPNIFEDSEKCSKEDIADWNSSPIYDKYPNEDYKLCKQEVEEDDDRLSLFKYKRLLILQKRIIQRKDSLL